jgi:hypothetical protein
MDHYTAFPPHCEFLESKDGILVDISVATTEIPSSVLLLQEAH